MAMFDGGGYVAELGYNSLSAINVIKVLEENRWIDNQTAAVFVEFTVFEPSSSLFSAIKLLFERSPIGGSHALVNIKTLSLYASPDPKSRSLFQICQLLLMIILIVFIFAEIGKLRREKCSYFTGLWNWLELFQISSTICALVFFFLKESQTSQFVKKIQENPFKTSSTDNIEFMSDLETYLLSFVIFIVTIKFLRLIKFNRHVCQVIGTMQRAATKVFSFMTVFVIIMLAYTQVGFVVFSSEVKAYSSFYSSLRAMLLLLFGGEMYFQELQSTSRYITPVFLFGYLSSMAMVLLNMFLAVLNDSYKEVKNFDPGEAFADVELGQFIIDYASQKIQKLKDDTLELVEYMVCSLIRFFQKDEQNRHDSDLEEAKLELLEDNDGVDNENEGYPLLKATSLSIVDNVENMSLGDLKQDIMRIGKEMRQSLTSLQSNTDRKYMRNQSAPHNVRSNQWLKYDIGSNQRHSSYFSASGSYLEDIWRKDRENHLQDAKVRNYHDSEDGQTSKSYDKRNHAISLEHFL